MSIETKLTNAQIAWRAAQDIQDGAYVNLGIGFPEMVAKFQPEGRQAIFHTENGVLNFGESPAAGTEDWDLINAGKKAVTLRPGAAFFHHADSFAMVRGGHLVDAARPERGVREHEDAHGVTFRAVGGVVTAPLQRRRHRHGVAQELVGHLQRHSRVPAAADPRGGGIELVRRLETGAFGHRRRPTRRRASRSDDWSEGGHKTPTIS